MKRNKNAVFSCCRGEWSSPVQGRVGRTRGFWTTLAATPASLCRQCWRIRSDGECLGFWICNQIITHPDQTFFREKRTVDLKEKNIFVNSAIVTLIRLPYLNLCYHRLNMEVDLQSLFGLHGRRLPPPHPAAGSVDGSGRIAECLDFQQCWGIRIRRIRMFLGLPDPDCGGSAFILKAQYL